MISKLLKFRYSSFFGKISTGLPIFLLFFIGTKGIKFIAVNNAIVFMIAYLLHILFWITIESLFQKK